MSRCHNINFMFFLNYVVFFEDLRRFDSDATFLFIFSGISEASLASFSSGNNTSFADERIRQCRLSVVDVSDDGHVPDILLPVHDLADLVYGKVHL